MRAIPTTTKPPFGQQFSRFRQVIQDFVESRQSKRSVEGLKTHEVIRDLADQTGRAVSSNSISTFKRFLLMCR